MWTRKCYIFYSFEALVLFLSFNILFHRCPLNRDASYVIITYANFYTSSCHGICSVSVSNGVCFFMVELLPFPFLYFSKSAYCFINQILLIWLLDSVSVLFSGFSDSVFSSDEPIWTGLELRFHRPWTLRLSTLHGNNLHRSYCTMFFSHCKNIFLLTVVFLFGSGMLSTYIV